MSDYVSDILKWIWTDIIDDGEDVTNKLNKSMDQNP